MVVHSLNAGSTFTTMACPHGSINVASGTKFNFLSLLFSNNDKRYYNMAIDAFVFGNSGIQLIDFVAVFLYKNGGTILCINPGSSKHKFINVHKFINCEIKRTYRAPK